MARWLWNCINTKSIVNQSWLTDLSFTHHAESLETKFMPLVIYKKNI